MRFSKHIFIFLLFAGASLWNYSSAQSAPTRRQLELEAKLLLAAGEDEKAQKAYSLLNQVYPRDDGYAFELARLFFLQGRMGECLELLAPFVAKPAPAKEILLLQGNAAEISGDTATARKVYERGIFLYPDQGAFFHALGNLVFESGDTVLAVNTWERGIQMAPDFAGNYRDAALMYCRTKEKIRSVLYAEIFLLLAPDDSSAILISDSLYSWYRQALSDPGALANGNIFSGRTEIQWENLHAGYPAELRFEDKFSLAWYYAATELNEFSPLSFLGARNRFYGSFASIAGKSARRNPLLRYYQSLNSALDKIHPAHYGEAWHYWIFGDAFPDETQQWIRANPELWKEFTGLISAHPFGWPRRMPGPSTWFDPSGAFD